MKIVETKLYRFDELEPKYQIQAHEEYRKSFISMIPIEEVWFTSIGLIYPIFNT